MRVSQHPSQDRPVINFFITWALASIVISYNYTSSLVFELPFMFISSCSFLILIYFTKSYENWENMGNLTHNIKTKTNLKGNSAEQTLSQYQKMIDINTKRELQDLDKIPLFNRWRNQKIEQEKTGKNAEIFLCSPQTAYQIEKDVFELKKMESLIFDDQ